MTVHRRSPAVGSWSPPAGERSVAGPLAVRDVGTGAPVVLLHGLLSSGDVFGGAYDSLSEHRRLVVPDLLGFGGSMDQPGDRFGLTEHLDALDAMADDLHLPDRGWTIAGHSLGGILALHWAARHPARVERVVAFAAPLHRSRSAALDAIDRSGPLERLAVRNPAAARRVCAWMCRHRALAGYLAVLGSPELPVHLARTGVLHTWPAYRGALEIILDPVWAAPLDTLVDADVAVTLAAGAADTLIDLQTYTTAAGRVNTLLAVHPDADHGLTLGEPAWCLAHLDADGAP